MLPQLFEAERPPTLSQGPGEGSFALGELETLEGGVQVRPTSRCGATRIGYDGRLATIRARSCDHPQQLTLGGPLAASDAGPDRTDSSVTWSHQRRV